MATADPSKKNLSIFAFFRPLLESVVHINFYYPSVMFWPFDPDKNAIQGDAPEGSETF